MHIIKKKYVVRSQGEREYTQVSISSQYILFIFELLFIYWSINFQYVSHFWASLFMEAYCCFIHDFKTNLSISVKLPEIFLNILMIRISYIAFASINH